MRQHVTEPTHVAGRILDVLITRDTDSTVSNEEISDPGLSVNNETRLVITSLLFLMLVYQNHDQFEKL